MLTLPSFLQQLEVAVPAQLAWYLAVCCIFGGLPFRESCPRHTRPCCQGAKEPSRVREQGKQNLLLYCLLHLPPPTSHSLRQFSALQLCQRSLMSAWCDVIRPATVDLKRCISLLLEESRGRRKVACLTQSCLRQSLQLERNSPFPPAFHGLRSVQKATAKTKLFLWGSWTMKVTQGLLES